jgi:hypothetical protein
MAYKQQPKSPVLKALVGDQHKLPKVLKDAIEASPAKQTKKQMARGAYEKDGLIYEPGRAPRQKKYPGKITDIEKLDGQPGYKVTTHGGKVNPDNLKQAVLHGKSKRAEKKSPAKQTKEAMKEAAPSTLEVERPSKLRGNSKPQKMTKTTATKALKKAKEKASPAKQSTYKGGGRKTDAQMADRTRRVDEGLTVRRNDYAPGKEGQAAFNADRKASFSNRRTKHESIRTRLKSGEITGREAQRERNDYAKAIQKSASYKRTKADRNMGDAPTTFVISRKGIKRKVSDAEKASYESVAKKTVDPTKPKKRMKKTPSSTESRGQGVSKGMSRAGSSTPRRMSKTKVKKQGRPTSINGNVIKY